MEPIIVTPEYSETKGPKELSSEIIQKLTSGEKIYLVGIGSSIPLALSGVNMTRNIANVNINSITLDYLPVKIFGRQEALFIELGLGQEKEKTTKTITKFEKMDEQAQKSRIIWVSKGDNLATVTNEILFKLSNYEMVMVLASGFTIYFAVKSILQVVKTNISKEKVSIDGFVVKSILSRDGKTRVPAVSIYIVKGDIKQPEYLESLKKEILERD